MAKHDILLFRKPSLSYYGGEEELVRKAGFAKVGDKIKNEIHERSRCLILTDVTSGDSEAVSAYGIMVSKLVK